MTTERVRSDGYYRFFPGDYMRDTADLSMVEDGAYRRLLDHYYSEENLSSEPQRLYRICRAFTPEERAAVDFVVGRFFRKENDRLINSRAERELVARRAFVEEQSRKGKLSGAARRKVKGGAEKEPGLNPGLTQVEPEGQPKPNQAPASASAFRSGSAFPPEGSLEPKTRRRGKNPPHAFVLPESIPPETWQMFEEHRNRLRKPMTDRARMLIVGKLEKIGGNPAAVLDQSIRKGWQDVFPVQEDRAPLSRNRSPVEPKGFAALRALREEEGRT